MATLSLRINADSIQIMNGKSVIKSIHIFNESERQSKIDWMQKKMESIIADNNQFNSQHS